MIRKIKEGKGNNMENLTYKLKILNGDAVIPTKGSCESAGLDLYATDESVTIMPNQTLFLHTGIAITPPAGYFGAVFARSGLACKRGLRPANCVGVIDYDYTGEIMVALHNDSSNIEHVKKGDRIAQLVFLPYINTRAELVDVLNPTERGAGGFASTGY